MNPKPKILVLSASSSLPRKTENRLIKWESIYINQLREAYPEFEIVYVTIGAATMKVMKNQTKYFKVLQPEIVIMIIGASDSAPRGFGKLEIEIIKKLRLFRLTKPFVNFLRKHRAHKYVSPKEYEKLLLEIRDDLNPKIFASIGIIPATDEYEKLAPGISKSIELYNSILKKNTHFVDVSGIPREGILKDHCHINEIGHDYIFSVLNPKMKEWVSKL